MSRAAHNSTGVVTAETWRRGSAEMFPALSRRRHGVAVRRATARYDAAQITADNTRHWANADALSADAANSAGVRRLLRNRARYEVANNSYAKGMVLTLANDLTGTGPRLQCLTESDRLNREIESRWKVWAKAIGLAAKLRTMRHARASDGEAFGLLITEPDLPTPETLDVKLIEADQVATPTPWLSANQVDGIELTPTGRPRAYHLLASHPGATWKPSLGYRTVSAAAVVHWFRADRPGQHRGIPDITPALPLFAQLRRYTLAVLASAETAAEFAAVLYTDAPADDEVDHDIATMDVVELERRMATVLPEGWKLGQIRAEQPTTTYAEFKKEILNEIARCLNVPYNVAACNSADYNYASGRLDHQTYHQGIRVERENLEAVVLDRILMAWLAEAVLLEENALPAEAGVSLPHQWFWDGMEHVDPAKEAVAQERRLKNNTTTLADEHAKQGKDWETQLRQRAKEKKLMQELDLEPAEKPTPVEKKGAVSHAVA